MSLNNPQKKKQIPVREGLFAVPLSPLDQARLEVIPLSRRGSLWTYTVIRHRPPGDYKGPEPFVPFGEGLVELPEGIRVLSPIDGDVEKLKIGMELELVVYKLYEDEEGNDVTAFKFKPV